MFYSPKLLPNKTRFHWRLVKRNKRAVSLFSKVLFFSAAALATAGIASAEPTGGTITSGSGTITQNGTATNIDQATQRLDIDWRTFSTRVNESINFAQPNASAIAVNRVTGGVPSELRGALNANGRIFIINDSGITFHGTSQVNVGALMATTASTVDVDGDSFGFSHDGYSQVINHGNITVSDGGFAILAAPYVANTGVIKANLGHIQLTSAQAYTLDLRGDGLITFTVDAAAIGDIEGDGKTFGVDNTGTLQARSGEVAVTATTVAKVVNSVVNLGGVVDADAFTTGADGGTVLASSAGDLNITGAVHADGGVDGNGGEVVTWADGTNHFATGATISARGGSDAGDGGFIEVSGNDVRFRGTADASAANGAAGTMLLDPTDLTIADGAGVDGAATVYEENIEAMSVAGTNVVLEADNSITMEDLGDDELLGGSGDINLRTTGNDGGTGTITMAAGDTIATTTGSIIIDANGSAADVSLGSLEVTGDAGQTESAGAVTVTSSSGSIAVGAISITADVTSGATALARLTLEAADDITVSGDTLLTATAAAQGSDSAIATADADIVAGTDGTGSLTIDGLFAASATAGRSTDDSETEGDALATADVYLAAANDVTITSTGNTLALDATASNSSTDGADLTGDAIAEAFLRVLAGQNDGNEGDIVIEGDATVDAGATLAAADGGNTDGTALAASLLLVDAADNVTMMPTEDDLFTGNDIGATATADSTGSDATAAALTVIEAGERFLLDELGAEVYFSEGNVNVTGNVFADASADATGGEDESAAAVVELTAHGGGPEFGSVVNEYFGDGGEPVGHAQTGGGEETADALPGEVATVAPNDTDGTPYTFIEMLPGFPDGSASLTEGETELPSEDLDFFFEVLKFFLPGTSAASVVHYHDQVSIIEVAPPPPPPPPPPPQPPEVVDPEPEVEPPPVVVVPPPEVEPPPVVVVPPPEVEPPPVVVDPEPEVEPPPVVVVPPPVVVEPPPVVVEPPPVIVEPAPEVIEPEPEDGDPTPDPYILTKDETDTPQDPPASGSTRRGGLGLVPGQMVCTLGEDGISIGSDGNVLFSQFFFEQTALEFGENGCDEVVSYPEDQGTSGK